jgi:UPF0042 nucleotide-binding protein
MRLVVISGMSGSGKTIALQALEDIDYYCVDNLPVTLLTEFARQMIKAGDRIGARNIAVGIDARNVERNLKNFGSLLADIRALGFSCEVIFLEADTETLIKRFSETRRKHPLTGDDTPLVEALAAERALLTPISACADLTVDTTTSNVHQLRSLIAERIAQRKKPSLSMLFISFGYKNGIPADADFVFDVRCLPNPHWEPSLRQFDGRREEVKAFLEQHPQVGQMYDDIKGFLERWVPAFEKENRNYMSVAIGCTGGQHRSVYLVESIAGHFRRSRNNIVVRHRELS